MEGLAALLHDSEVSAGTVIAVVHHAPLLPDGTPDTRLHGLSDGRALLSLLQGPRRAILHGHVHRNYHLKPTPQRPHVFGAGSSTARGRQGYWLIDATGESIDGIWVSCSGSPDHAPVPMTS
jgi:hypothetical protein